MFRRRKDQRQVFLVHPGGPYWKNKDAGTWSIPKGEYGEKEDPLDAAKREFEEETGIEPAGEFVSLNQMKQPDGEIVRAWAVDGDCSSQAIRSNTVRSSTNWRRAPFPTSDTSLLPRFGRIHRSRQCCHP
jgi:predicted NUDIX family NTP pyrophosphohydrolase